MGEIACHTTEHMWGERVNLAGAQEAVISWCDLTRQHEQHQMMHL